MSVKKVVRKSEIEQLQVQDVHTEIEPEETDPSPLRPAIGTKKIAAVKVSRIVVRESPEERLRRTSDFTTDYSFHDGGLNFNLEEEPNGQTSTVNTFESVRSQLQYSTSGNNGSLSPGKPMNSPKPVQNGGYVLHLPAGTAFDAFGSVVSTDETGQQQAVRLNLSDFLKACQVRSTFSSSTTQPMEVPPALPMNGNTVSSSLNDENDLEQVSEQAATAHLAAVETARSLKLSLPTETLSLEDLTPINMNSSTKSNFNSFFNASTPPAKDLSLDWAATPASSGKPPLSPGLNRLVSSKHLNGASQQHSNEPPPPPPPQLVQTPRNTTSQSILLPSPHPNIENVPTLRLSESTSSTPATAPQTEKLFEEVVTHRTQRKFVWERGSGEVSQASTVEVTPLLSRHRGRIADVAAVAPVSINHYFKTYAEEPREEERSKSAPPRSPAAKKVTKYLKHTPSADVDVTLRSNNSTPGTDEKRKSTPLSTRRPSLTAISVRDETNSLPRSIAPQPTPSPKYDSPDRTKKTKEVGPYTFHKANPAPISFEIRTDPKRRSASASAANSNAKPAANLATTRKPFGFGRGSPAPKPAKKVVEEQPRDLEGRLNAVSEMDENGNRPHSVLISLVHELRDEVIRHVFVSFLYLL